MPEQVDYSGAVYGSLLAGSVVAGASPRHDPPGALTLMTVLLATGLVFWLAHVYAHLAGARVGRAELRRVAHAEAPLAQAAVPPALAAFAGWLAGLPDATTAWLCLLVAVAEQVGWAATAVRRSGLSRRYALVSAVVNLCLGVVIIALKAALAH